MNFLDFYNAHYVSMTAITIIAFVLIIILIIWLITKSNKKVKTPWFEIAPDSVKVPETDDMGKTRLLLKRQFDYVDNYMNGVSSVLLALEKSIVNDAINRSNINEVEPHTISCLINSSTNELTQKLKYYMNGLLVINHIGSDKEKIKKYAKSHVCQIMAIIKKHLTEIFTKLSGEICTDLTKYWNEIKIENPNQQLESYLVELLLGLSELRYSDFDVTNDQGE